MHFEALKQPNDELWQTLARGTVAINLPPSVLLKAFQSAVEGQHGSVGKQRQVELVAVEAAGEGAMAAADIKAGTVARRVMSRAIGEELSPDRSCDDENLSKLQQGIMEKIYRIFHGKGKKSEWTFMEKVLSQDMAWWTLRANIASLPGPGGVAPCIDHVFYYPRVPPLPSRSAIHIASMSSCGLEGCKS